MDICTLGIDLSKTAFHVIGFNAGGEIVLRRKFSRMQLLRFTSNRQPMLIGMEACGGAHFLGRLLKAQGHDARLMAAQFVKAFRKSNKNDYLDAEAIAEAVQRPTMRFVPIKTDDQLDLQALHRVRDRWVARRTAVMNQMRGFLLERGITIARGPSHLTTQLQEIVEDSGTLLSGRLRLLILELKHEWDELDQRIEEADAELRRIARQDDACRRLMEIPGFGTAGVDRARGLDRQRDYLSQRQRSGSVAGTGSSPTLHRRQDQAAGHQQTGERISATHVPAWGSLRGGANRTEPLAAWIMAGESVGTKSSQCGGGGFSQQDGSDGMGDPKQGNSLLHTCSGSSMNCGLGKATPWKSRKN